MNKNSAHKHPIYMLLRPDQIDYMSCWFLSRVKCTSGELFHMLRVKKKPLCSSCFYYICCIFATTLIWIIQNYWRMCSCQAVSIIAIHFCMVLQTLWPHRTSACSESIGLRRSMRSNKEITVSDPRVKTNAGARAFHSRAPSLRNNLPLPVCSWSVATFRKPLKTHLFDLAFAR